MEMGPLGENPKTEYRAANLHVQREVVSGVRRVWGTVKSASHFTVKNTIVKLADVESVDSIHVKRKHKTTRIRLTDSHACGPPMDQSSVSQKRKDRSSPLPSPQKLTRSPLPKIQKRHRTGSLALNDNRKWENYHLHQSHICKPLSSERAVAVL